MKYILTADWHIRDTTPRCRTDNYWMKQWNKINQVLQIAQEEDAVVLIAGDVFDKPRVSNQTIEKFMSVLRTYSDVLVLAIAGNHDLPGHNLDNLHRSAIGIMFQSGLIGTQSTVFNNIIDLVHFGEEIPNEGNILVYHELMWYKKRPFPGAPETGNAKTFFKKHKKHYDLILTGDNHQQFELYDDDCLMINPGPIMRMSADQWDFKPAVYLYDSEDGSFDIIELEVQDGVVQRDHIEEKKDKENRSKAFIKRMKDTDMEMDFVQNMSNYIAANKINKKTEDIIWEVIDD